MRALRAAIALEPGYAEAHCNLGLALAQQGQFAKALAAMQTGHKLGCQRPDWPRATSAGWIAQVERLIAVDAKLTAVLSGKRRPADAQERLQLAAFCLHYKQRYRTAAAWYGEAFAAAPAATADRKAGHRYDAACAAALAGSGQGRDTGKLNDAERAVLRQQALDWLRADLTIHAKRLQGAAPNDRTLLAQQMQHWQRDRDLAVIRENSALARLPAGERAASAQLWAERHRARRQGARGEDTVIDRR